MKYSKIYQPSLFDFWKKAPPYRRRTTPRNYYSNTVKYIAPAIGAATATALSGLKPYKQGLRGRASTQPKKAVKKLSTQVRNIQKNINSNTGFLTHKQRDAYDLSASKNEQNMATYSPLNINRIETILSAVPYFAGGILTNINLTDDTFQRKVRIKSVASSLNIRNNRITPCQVRVYVMKIKGDTGNSPTTLFTTGLTDQQDTPQPKHPMLYLSDIEQVKDLWTQVKCYKKYLNAGQEFNVSHAVKDIVYDTSLTDTHPQFYQKAIKSFVFVVRIEGVPAFENTLPANVGTADTRVNIIMDTVYKLEYDSGSNGTKRIVTVDNQSSMENDPVIAQVTRRIQNSAGSEGY